MLHDQNIVGVPADKIVSKGMALCPEGRRIFLQMTVLENLEMGGYTRPNSELEESIENVYDHFPRLKERYKQVAGTLSGGEQQMLAMGRALMSKPKLMMMDEPSMGLAPILVEQIFDIIRELKQVGTTILLVEQNAQRSSGLSGKLKQKSKPRTCDAAFVVFYIWKKGKTGKNGMVEQENGYTRKRVHMELW